MANCLRNPNPQIGLCGNPLSKTLKFLAFYPLSPSANIDTFASFLSQLMILDLFTILSSLLNKVFLEYVSSKLKIVSSKVLFTNKTPAKHRDIFRDTLIAKKYGGEEVRTYDLQAGKQKKFKHQPGFEPRTYNLIEPPYLNNVHKWSGHKVEFWQN